MKVRRHARNVLCKVDSHRRIKTDAVGDSLLAVVGGLAGKLSLMRYCPA
jgi:hypothetical protein